MVIHVLIGLGQFKIDVLHQAISRLQEETWLHGEVKKQEVVARSSAEAEYRGMAKAICELLWIRNLMLDLQIKPVNPMKLYCDNKAACDIAHNPVQHDRTKHVEVDRHFIKEKLEEKLIEVPHVRSQDQLADVLTKALSNQAFNDCLNKLGMSDIYAPT